MQSTNNLEESLRETASLGETEKVEMLLRAGVDVNSQNKVNGWTALHWAARRNHKHIVSYLLQNGADCSIRAFKNECAADVTQNTDIKQLLLGKENKNTEDVCAFPSISEFLQDAKVEPLQDPGFVPNYLVYPKFPYSESVAEFASRVGIQTRSIVTEDAGLASSHQNTSEELTCSVLVLKCRLADSEETDFIEIELDRKCLNFDALMETCLNEFSIDSKEKVKKFRKLPNTIIRNDGDVKRLTQNQEIEIVLN